MDDSDREEELLRQLRVLDARLRPLGIRLKPSPSMLRPSRRLRVAEKLFDLYSEHGMREAFELFFEFASDPIVEIISSMVEGADLSEWLAIVCFEFYCGRVDLSQGFEHGIVELVHFLMRKKKNELTSALAREITGTSRPEKTGAACRLFVESASWGVLEILGAAFVEGLSLGALSSRFSMDARDIESVLVTARGSIEALIDATPKDSPGEEWEES